MNAADRYRQAAAALRGIARNGGRTAATTNAIERHTADKGRAVVELIAAGRRDLVGLLVEEEKLAARPDVRTRPELRSRLQEIRRQIRAAE